MFGKKNGNAGFETLIGTNTVMDGNVTSESSIKIDGKITGDVKTSGNLFLSEKAEVKGSLWATDVHISGTVDGNVYSKGILHLMSTAKVYGDVQVNSFVADEGAVFQGKCNMVEFKQTEELA